MFNTAFDAFTNERTDYYPSELRGEIDAINKRVFESVNKRRLSLGLCQHAGGHEEAFLDLFATLDWLEEKTLTPAGISRATASPKRTGGCSPPSCASTRSTTATSNAICAASRTIRTCRTICASFIRCRASPTR